MDLHNADLFYEKAKKTDKKPPKEWLRLKSSKDLVDALEHGEVVGDNGEFYFDDRLLFHYRLYLYPEVAVQYTQTGTKKHWCEDVKEELEARLGEGLFRIVFQKALERVTGVSYVDYSRKYGIQDIWGSLAHEAKDVIASFLSVVLVACKAYNKKIDTYYLDSLFHEHSEALSRHLLLSRTKTIAKNEKGKVYINRKNYVSWKENSDEDH
jgi:hypothetical protein